MADQDPSKGFKARLIPLGSHASTDQLLGVRATPTEVDDLLRMVDRQGTGDIGYQGFTQVMTNTMNKMDSNDALEDDGGAAALQAAVPFEITASAYRRHKLIEALREGDRDLIASMAQGQEALKNNLNGTASGVKGSSQAGRASTAGGREPTASPMIAAISAKLKAGRPAKPRENPFELEGIPHPELFTPEQRYALRQILHRQAAQDRMLLESRGLQSRSQVQSSPARSSPQGAIRRSPFRQPAKPMHLWHLPGKTQARRVGTPSSAAQGMQTSTPKHAAIQRHLMALQRLANSSTPSAKRPMPPLPSVTKRPTSSVTPSPRLAQPTSPKPAAKKPDHIPARTKQASSGRPPSGGMPPVLRSKMIAFVKNVHAPKLIVSIIAVPPSSTTSERQSLFY
ncbi:hypothetical protein WJX84_001752 [Apatococcus fuscideae]|uniref:EF-hand domain-containing protein n=1 Tax=Apatococcus fuscideae TaxID=2026836 RepID=A0AAW1THN5_9CHLO